MIGKKQRLKKPDAELDITSFMNLMIVLVPVLLMMMVFSRITVLELKLPGLEALADGAQTEAQQLEVWVSNTGMKVFFPAGYLVRDIPIVQNPEVAPQGKQISHDFDALQFTLKQIKQTLLSKGVEKQDIVLMMDDDVPYQTIVTLMDKTRSYKDVVAASVVDAELFPNVSLADAPLNAAPLTPTQSSTDIASIGASQ